MSKRAESVVSAGDLGGGSGMVADDGEVFAAAPDPAVNEGSEPEWVELAGRGPVYLVMIVDAGDPIAFPFARQDRAVEFARTYAGHMSGPDPVVEEQVQGWLYFASYRGDRGRVWVYEARLR